MSRPRLRALTDRHLAIVAAYRSLGTLEAAAAPFAVTRERVRQVLVLYERLTGDRVPRSTSHPAPRTLWRCPGCSSSRFLRPGDRAPALCQPCRTATRPPASHLRRFLTDELVDRVVAEVPAGRATFSSLAREAGYTAPGALIYGVYLSLARRGDAASLARLWPASPPPWVTRRAARRLPAAVKVTS